jgi:transcriptional regulator with XRE-family HTH domain
MIRRARRITKSIHSADYAAFCALLAEARTTAGLTQHSLAKRLRKPQSFIAKYEGGERRLDVVEFVTISRAIGVDPLRLFKELLKRVD